VRWRAAARRAMAGGEAGGGVDGGFVREGLVEGAEESEFPAAGGAGVEVCAEALCDWLRQGAVEEGLKQLEGAGARHVAASSPAAVSDAATAFLNIVRARWRRVLRARGVMPRIWAASL